VYVSHWHGAPALTHQAHAAAALLPAAGIIALASGGSGIVVDCTVFLPNQPKPALVKRFENSSWDSFSVETNDNASAESAGESIVAAILKH
jgi:hypothetical protein